MSRTVQNPDGSFTAQVSSEPLNYKDATGTWKPIDSTLVRSSTQGFAWENSANSFVARFAADPTGAYTEFVTPAGGVSISLLGIDQATLAAAPAALTAAARGELVYPSVEPGMNLAYRMTSVGVKESIVLTNADAPASYSFLVHPRAGQQLGAKQGGDGGWTFTSSDGSVAFRLAAPSVAESATPVLPKQCLAPVGAAPPVCTGGPAGTPPAPPAAAAGIGADDGGSAVVSAPGQGTLDVVPSGGDFKVTVSVDSSWLASPKRVFPVVIDPTVVLSGSLDSDGTFTQNCATCTPDMSSDHIKVGYDGTNTYLAASKFDTSSVPGGSKIVSATLNVNFDHCFPADSYPDPNIGCSWVWPWQSLTLDAHRISNAWSSTTQTQNFAYDSTVVASNAFTLGYPGVGIGPGTPLQWDVSSLVQQWSSGIQQNNGIVLVNSQSNCGSFSSSPCGVTIEDSRYATTNLRPYLSITYTPTLGADSRFPMWNNGAVAVNEATGNLVLAPPSPSFPTAVGTLNLPIGFNSLNTSTAGSHPFGTGWTAGPTSWLVDHTPLGDAKSIEQFFGDGSSVVFTEVGQNSNVFRPNDGSNSTLFKTSSTTAPYTITADDGSVWTYHASDPTTGIAQLIDVETLQASTGTGAISYAFNGSGQLTSVTAKDASTTIASLSLKWAGDPACTNAIVCVTGPDGQTWQYIGTGGATGPLQTVFDGTRNVFKVTYDGSGRVATVQNANDLNPPAGYNVSHNLTISYDSSNRVSSVANGPISGQTPATSTWSFVYHPDLSGATTTDAVVNNHGVSGQPNYVAAGTHRQTAGYTTVTPPCEQAAGTCSGHSGTVQVKVYYDGLSQTMERVELPGADTVTHHTQMFYSASGQLLWTEDEDGNPTDYSYDSTDNTLSTATAPDPDGGGSAPRPVTTYNYDETTYGSVTGSTYTPGAALLGVQAAYYKTQNFLSVSGVGRPDVAETDVSAGSFTFNWLTTGPPSLYSSGTNTNYSVRFLGDLIIPSGSTPTIEFETIAQGGTQLTIDGYDYIDDLTDTGSSTQAPGTQTLLQPGRHRLVLSYVEAAASPNSNLQLLYKCDANCGSLPTTFTAIPATNLAPAWGNQTSTVSPVGRVSFSHYLHPQTGSADYTLVNAPVNGTTTPLVTHFEYDTLGRMIGKVMPNGNVSAAIGSDGTLSGYGLAASSNWGTVYGYYGDTTTASSPAACAIHGTYPQLGLLQSVTQHGLHSATTVYDSAGRPASVTNATGTAVSCYDNEGGLVSSQSALQSQPTIYRYDPAGDVISASHAGTSDDTQGTLTSRYDEAGRLTAAIDASGAEATYSYDADGNLLTRSASIGSTVTATGNELTDANRSAGVQGDGRVAPDSSYGIWQAATNLETNGGYESGTTNAAANDATTTITTSQTAVKFGTHSLKVVDQGSVVGEGVNVISTGAAASTTYTFSTWIYSPTATQLYATLQDRDSSGAFLRNATGVGGLITLPAGSWQRFSWAWTTGASTARVELQLDNTSLGAQAKTYYLDGVQVEQNAFSTPYVQTDGATATRNAGGVNLPVGAINGTQGWAAFRVRPGFASTDPSPYGSGLTQRVLFVGNYTTSFTSLLELVWDATNHAWNLQRNESGALATTGSQSFTAGTPQTVVVAWTSTAIKISVNGGAFASVADATNPNLSTYAPQIGRRFDGGSSYSRWFDGDVLWATYGTGTLTDANAATLNSNANTDPTLPAFTYGTPALIWDANTASDETNTTTYTTTSTYDDEDQLTAQTDPSGHSYGFFYDSRGNLRGTQYPNNTFSWTDANPLGETSDVYNRHDTTPITAATTTAPADSSGSTLGDYTYQYTADAQKSQQTSIVGTAAAQTTAYTYDSVGRLQQITPSTGTSCTAYYYDADSNRTQIRTATNSSGCGAFSTATTYAYTTGTNIPADALTTAGSTNYTYAGGGTTLGDGQVTARGTDAFTWDTSGRLQTATHTSNTACYLYDPAGALLTRTYKTSATNCTTPTGTTNYLLGDLAESNAAGTITTSYQDGPASDLTSYAGAPTTATATYLYYDGHGNQVNQANSSGTATGTAQSYDPWGNAQAALPANATVHAYTGRWDKQTDTTTNLILMGARPYDPNLGRFIAVDPIDGGSLNNYDYAGQDPVNGYDLSGTYLAQLVDGTGGGGVPLVGLGAIIGCVILCHNVAAVWINFAEPDGTYQSVRAKSHPQDKLPSGGEYPYRPQKQKGKPEVVPNPQGSGYVDRRGDIWVWDPRHGGHWDVEDRRNPNRYKKVSPEGKILPGGNP